ncbi:MAG: DHA2 family efflux MFS transporter permease subunit [Candidatus Thermoplasmatota archaeon]
MLTPERIHKTRWWILLVLCLSLALVVLDNTVINVALPTLAQELGAGGTELQWIVDAYVLVFGGLLLTMGALGDRYGRRGALQAGLIIIAGSSVAVLFATEARHLLPVRAMMGVGAALVMPATLSILTQVFPKEERGRAMGIWAAVAGVGGIVGLVIGGWLLEHFSWQSVFTLNVPIAAVALVAGLFLLPRSRDERRSPLDPVGTVLSIVALTSLLFAIIEGPAVGWAAASVLVATVVALVAWPTFVWWERRTRFPMLPLGLFRDRGFAVGNLVIALAFLTIFAVFFAMTQYLQFVRGYSPFDAGIRFLPMIAGMASTATQSDRLARRIGTQRTVGAGLFLVTLALIGLSFVGIQTDYAFVALGLLLLGAGMGAAMAPSTTIIMDAVPPEKAGVGSAMNDTSREVGAALGVAILGSTLNAVYSRALDIAATLPTAVRDAASQGIATAFMAAHRLPAPTGDALRASASDAFVAALQVTYWAAAAVTFIGAIIALLTMPDRQAARPKAHAVSV